MKPKVLFVDDERDVLDSMRDALRKKPFDVLLANSAKRALEILDQHRIEIVVSDERMPEMTGHELLAEVYKRHPDTIRIMLTGQASMEAMTSAIDDGQVYRFLAKPCTPEELALHLGAALDMKASMHERRSAISEAGLRGRRAAMRSRGEDELEVAASLTGRGC